MGINLIKVDAVVWYNEVVSLSYIGIYYCV